MTGQSNPAADPAPAALRPWYQAVWRWHFYAGLFVVPFLAVLALSGMVMALKGPIESYLYEDLLFVEPTGEPRSAAGLVEAVAARYPHAEVRQYIVPRDRAFASQITIVPMDHGSGAGHGRHGEALLTVFVDPYSGEVLGELDPAATLYAWANTLHGTLFLGEMGDHLIEIAAGLALLLVASGLYLWWSRDGGWRQRLLPRLVLTRRPGWRDLHACIGFWAAGALVFFLVSGLTWTDVWGGRLVQAWSSLPAERIQAPLAAADHATLNRGGLEEVPWVLEQTPLPVSGSSAGWTGVGPGADLDAVIAFGRREGFERFRVHLPRGPNGVWTLSASTMAGELTDPRKERTVHLDRHTGRVLADIRFADYPLMGQAMAAGVPLHQAELGGWNVVFNLAVCLAVLGLLASGVVMWWLRRPAAGSWLQPPPLPADVGAWRGAIGVMFALSLGLPLVMLTLAGVILLDVLLSRLPWGRLRVG